MPLSLGSRLFVKPPANVYGAAGGPTYTGYNYLGGGPVAWVKRRHFEAALDYARPWFDRAPVIDFGCADGVFLPSLSRRFPSVRAVDLSPIFTDLAQRVVDELALDNVRVVCNERRSMASLADEFAPDECELLFLLETLEHVGDPRRFYESKIDFLNDLFGLLAPTGRIVISVPTMVGLPFLVQRMVLGALRMTREPISAPDFARAVFLRRADTLEADWQPHKHLGFNHVELERHLRREFAVVHRQSLVFTELFVIARTGAARGMG
jgi:SAM-dependent methyltransferase